MKAICPTCKKREVVIDQGCAVCLFLRSDEEQERFRRIFTSLFEKPEVVCYPEVEQLQMAYTCLPYICTYKAQYKKAIWHFLKIVLDDMLEHYTVDIDIEEIPVYWWE